MRHTKYSDYILIFFLFSAFILLALLNLILNELFFSLLIIGWMLFLIGLHYFVSVVIALGIFLIIISSIVLTYRRITKTVKRIYEKERI